jgi:hypothetical protein
MTYAFDLLYLNGKSLLKHTLEVMWPFVCTLVVMWPFVGAGRQDEKYAREGQKLGVLLLKAL